MPVSTTATTARPRVTGEREEEIFDGTVEILLEVGYDRLTFDEVAARVRASKATLYRRWPSKALLVSDAVEHLFRKGLGDHAHFPDTGSLLGDVEATFCQDTPVSGQTSAVLAVVLPGMHRDPELRDIFVERVFKPKAAGVLDMLVRAQRRGEVGPGADLELLAAIIPAMSFHKVITEGTLPDACFVERVVKDAFLPAVAATLTG